MTVDDVVARRPGRSWFERRRGSGGPRSAQSATPTVRRQRGGTTAGGRPGPLGDAPAERREVAADVVEHAVEQHPHAAACAARDEARRSRRRRRGAGRSAKWSTCRSRGCRRRTPGRARSPDAAEVDQVVQPRSSRRRRCARRRPSARRRARRRRTRAGRRATRSRADPARRHAAAGGTSVRPASCRHPPNVPADRSRPRTGAPAAARRRAGSGGGPPGIAGSCRRDPRDWFLTHEERENPHTRIDEIRGAARRGATATPCAPSCTAAPTSPSSTSGSATWGRGDRLYFADWQRRPRRAADRRPGLHAQQPRSSRPSGAASTSAACCGARTGTGSASAPHGTATSARRSGRPAASACGTCGCAPAARTTRSSWCSGTATTRAATSRTSAASTSATAAATTSDHHGDAQAARAGEGLRPDPGLARRPGRDPGPGGARRGDDVPRAVGGQHPAHPEPRPPAVEPVPPRGPVTRARWVTRRRPPPPEPRGTTSSRSCAPSRRSSQGLRLRARGRALGDARQPQGDPQAERLVYVEDQYLWSEEVGDHFAQRCGTTLTSDWSSCCRWCPTWEGADGRAAAALRPDAGA